MGIKEQKSRETKEQQKSCETREVHYTYLQKCQHDGGNKRNGGHSGGNTIDRDGDLSEGENTKVDRSSGSHTTWFSLSCEGEAFLEATFDSAWNIKTERPRSPNTASLVVSGRPVPRYLR